MKITTILVAALSMFGLLAVELEETPKAVTVKTAYYKLRMPSSRGYEFACEVKEMGKSFFVCHTTLFRNRENLEFGKKTYGRHPTPVYQPQKAVLKVLESSKERVRISIKRNYGVNEVTQEYTFSESPVIHASATVDFKNPLHKIVVSVSGNDAKELVFSPDGERVFGLPEIEDCPAQGKFARDDYWRIILNRNTGKGYGIVADSAPHYAGIEYQSSEKWEKSNHRILINLVYTRLSDLGNKGSFNFKYTILAGLATESVPEVIAEVTGNKPVSRILSMEMEKVVTIPGEKNRVSAVIVNPTSETVHLSLEGVLFYGLEEKVKLQPRKMTLKAGERKNVAFDIIFPEAVRWGASVQLNLKDEAGKFLSQKTEFCSVSDSAHAAASFGAINSHWVCRGYPELVNRFFRKIYVGGYEIYSWAPGTVGGLAPKENIWETETEYNPNPRKIEKKVLKDMIAEAHRRGIKAFAWVTHLCNYRYLYDHPEWLQYTKNGQPNTYCGVIGKNKRYARMKPNIFSPKTAYAWGKEMADSVDMFGWDGCRFDSTFRPDVPNDPLWTGEILKESWYDYRGIPVEKLYPDPDLTCARATSAWRKAVNQRHPKFVYGMNICSDPTILKKRPDATKAQATDALLLLEDMLYVNHEKYSTFQKWGTALAERTDVIRPFGAQPVVGTMWYPSRGTVSYHIANHIANSAGVKWWRRPYYALETEDREKNAFMLRFAEYYFDTTFRVNSAVKVSAKNTDRVFFAPFVRERFRNGVREIVVPMVNLPDNSSCICQLQKTPAIRKNLIFRCNINIASAWLMTPQHPEKAIRLSVRDGKVTIPELHDAAILLFQGKVK